MESKTEQHLVTQRTLEDKRRELLTLESKLQVLQELVQNSTSATAQQSQHESDLKVSHSIVCVLTLSVCASPPRVTLL